MSGRTPIKKLYGRKIGMVVQDPARPSMVIFLSPAGRPIFHVSRDALFDAEGNWFDFGPDTSP